VQKMSNYTFPKKYKMTLKADIDAVLKGGKRVFGRDLVLRYRLVSRDGEELKVLLIVPKRRFKLAVSRNRIKRQLREMIRSQKPKIIQALPEKQTLHLAIVYSGPTKMNFEQTSQNLSKALRKIEPLNLNNN